MENTILITGAAGFIGANLVLRLLADVENSTIIGLDNVNAYYDVSLKEYRLAQIEKRRSNIRRTDGSLSAAILRIRR